MEKNELNIDSKSCKYCELVDYIGDNMIKYKTDDHEDEVYIINNQNTGDIELNILLGNYPDVSFKINYCPMCGSKLKG